MRTPARWRRPWDELQDHHCSGMYELIFPFVPPLVIRRMTVEVYLLGELNHDLVMQRVNRALARPGVLHLLASK